MKVGFLTSGEYPHLTADDRLAVGALAGLGIEVAPLIWGEAPPKSLSAVVVRSPWSYYHQREKFLAWLGEAEKYGIPFWNPLELIRWNLDKKYLIDLGKDGVPVVPTLRLEGTAEEAIARVEQGPWDEVVVKPDISAGAYRTLRLKKDRVGTKRAIVSAILKTGALLVQPYLAAIETEGEMSLIYFSNGKEIYLSHGLRKLPKAGDFRVQQKHGGTLTSDLGGPEWDEAARRALAKVPHSWLYARVDLVRFEGKPVLGEMEVFEPELFFRLDPKSPGLFAACVKARLDQSIRQ